MTSEYEKDFDELVAASMRFNKEYSTVDGFLGSGIGFDNETKKIVFRVYIKPHAANNIPKIFEGVPVVHDVIDGIYTTMA